MLHAPMFSSRLWTFIWSRGGDSSALEVTAAAPDRAAASLSAKFCFGTKWLRRRFVRRSWRAVEGDGAGSNPADEPAPPTKIDGIAGALKALGKRWRYVLYKASCREREIARREIHNKSLDMCDDLE